MATVEESPGCMEFLDSMRPGGYASRFRHQHLRSELLYAPANLRRVMMALVVLLQEQTHVRFSRYAGTHRHLCDCLDRVRPAQVARVGSVAWARHRRIQEGNQRIAEHARTGNQG